MNVKKRTNLSTIENKKFYRDRRKILKLCEEWDQNPKARNKFRKIDYVLKHAVQYCVNKYNVSLAHSGSTDPLFYERQLENAGILGFTVHLYEETDSHKSNGELK